MIHIQRPVPNSPVPKATVLRDIAGVQTLVTGSAGATVPWKKWSFPAENGGFKVGMISNIYVIHNI